MPGAEALSLCKFRVVFKTTEMTDDLVFAGGSGLYVKILLDGIFEDAGSSLQLRTGLEQQASIKGVQFLHDKLRQLDPSAADKVNSNDLRRIIRALEVYYVTSQPISVKQKQVKGYWERFPILAQPRPIQVAV